MTMMLIPMSGTRSKVLIAPIKFTSLDFIDSLSELAPA